MSKQSGKHKMTVAGRVTLVADKVSVVRGASVSEVRVALAEAGFGEPDIQIQGIDIDDLDKKALEQILGKDTKEVRQLPILVRGIGTRSLRALLKEGVVVQPGGLDGPVAEGITCCTMTFTIPDTSTAMVLPITATVPTPPIGPPIGPLVLEGIDIDSLRRALGNAGFDLDRIRVRPLR